MKRFSRDRSGAALIEMSLVLPILLLLTFGAVQFAFIFYSLSAMESAARVAARAISVGEADDESNGSMTPCSGLTGLSASGDQSAEKIACDMLAILPGNFSVSASDGEPGDFAERGADVTVTVSLNRRDIVFADPFGLLQSSGAAIKTVTLRKE